MGTSITKQGIASATGTVGANLLPDTSCAEVQYTYPASGFLDKYSKTTTAVTSASKYTLSFYAKSTVLDDVVRAHFYSPNTTTSFITSQGLTAPIATTGISSGDGAADFTLSTEWKYYWVVYTQSTTTAAKRVIFPRMFANTSAYSTITGTGTVSIKCVKFEEGEHPTPWIPNTADSLYVGDNLGFYETPTNLASIQNGIILSNQFYEL